MLKGGDVGQNKSHNKTNPKWDLLLTEPLCILKQVRCRCVSEKERRQIFRSFLISATRKAKLHYFSPQFISRAFDIHSN